MSKRAVGESAGHEQHAGFVAGKSMAGDSAAGNSAAGDSAAGNSAAGDFAAGGARGDNLGDNLLEQLIQGTLAVEDGTLLFDRMVDHIRSLLPVPSFGGAAVREMVSVVVAERFTGGVWVHVNRDQLLDWLLERMMSSPAAERRLRELWGSVCRRILDLKN